MKWPLNVSQLSYLDRIKIATFFLTTDKWTMGDKVAEFEQKMAKYIGCKYAVLTSSGSTANTLLAMHLKDTQRIVTKNIIIFPSTTWITSVAPFIREGFKPYFIDISLKDFSLDLDKTDKFLAKNWRNVACVFPTSLIGYVPDISHLKMIEDKYDCRVMMDNCENTLGTYLGYNISSFFTSTTSLYFGHQICGVESGFIFTNKIEEYHYFLMARNHGMVRSLPEEYRELYQNKNVDKKFDFHLLGNNFRTTDINAYIGLLDFERRDYYNQTRKHLYNLFYNNLDLNRYYLPLRDNINYKDAPFCLPIINRNKLAKLKCEHFGIETRPILSGNLLRHSAFKNYIYNPTAFPNSDYLHDDGFYVGLHPKVREKDIIKLVKVLNY